MIYLQICYLSMRIAALLANVSAMHGGRASGLSPAAAWIEIRGGRGGDPRNSGGSVDDRTVDC